MGLHIGSKGLLHLKLVQAKSTAWTWTHENSLVVECIDMMSFVQRVGAFDSTTEGFCRALFLQKVPSLCRPQSLVIACFDDNFYVPLEKTMCQKKRQGSGPQTQAYPREHFQLIDDLGLLYNDGSYQPFSPIRLLQTRWLRPYLYTYMIYWLIDNLSSLAQVYTTCWFDFGTTGVLRLHRNEPEYMSDQVTRRTSVRSRIYRKMFRTNSWSSHCISLYESSPVPFHTYGEAEVACFAWALSYAPNAACVHILSGDFDCIGLALTLKSKFKHCVLRISIVTQKDIYRTEHSPLPPLSRMDEPLLSLLKVLVLGTDYIDKKLVFHCFRENAVLQACEFTWTLKKWIQISPDLVAWVIVVAHYFRAFPREKTLHLFSYPQLVQFLRSDLRSKGKYPSDDNVSQFIKQVMFNVTYWGNVQPIVSAHSPDPDNHLNNERE